MGLPTLAALPTIETWDWSLAFLWKNGRGFSANREQMAIFYQYIVLLKPSIPHIILFPMVPQLSGKRDCYAEEESGKFAYGRFLLLARLWIVLELSYICWTSVCQGLGKDMGLLFGKRQESLLHRFLFTLIGKRRTRRTSVYTRKKHCTGTGIGYPIFRSVQITNILSVPNTQTDYNWVQKPKII